MAWIKMREDLHEDPAVLWMAQELGVRAETIVGYCHRFWGLVSRQTSDGCIIGPSLLSLGQAISLPGFPELLVSAEWLEHDNSDPKRPVTRIPKFDRHLSEGAKARALALERKRKERGATSARDLSRSDRDKIATRGDKIREEYKPPIVPQGTTDLSGQSNGSTNIPETKPNKRRTRKMVHYDAYFEKWWAVYPKKVGKEAAQAEWIDAMARLAVRHPEWTDEQRRSHLGRAALAYAKSHLGQRFPLDPERWLKRGRFDDDPSAWEACSGAAHEPVDAPYPEPKRG